MARWSADFISTLPQKKCHHLVEFPFKCPCFVEDVRSHEGGLVVSGSSISKCTGVLLQYCGFRVVHTYIRVSTSFRQNFQGKMLFPCKSLLVGNCVSSWSHMIVNVCMSEDSVPFPMGNLNPCPFPSVPPHCLMATARSRLLAKITSTWRETSSA